MASVLPSKPVARFEHPALLYHDQRDYLATLMRFVSNGLNAGEPVLVAVPEGNLARLRTALGDDADRIEMRDMAVAGRNPGRIIGGVLLDFVARHPGRRVRIVGEPIWAGRDACEYPACVQHEALINAAFVGVDASILCPYHISGLDPSVLADAKRTHPIIWQDGRISVSADFDYSRDYADAFNVPLPTRPVWASTMAIDVTSTPATRRFTASHALATGLPIERVADAVIVVDELVNNTIAHGGGTGWLSAWFDGSRAVFEVRDPGFIADRLAGRRPTGAACRERGLALVHRQSDLVRVHTGRTGTVIRTYFSLNRSICADHGVSSGAGHGTR